MYRKKVSLGTDTTIIYKENLRAPLGHLLRKEFQKAAGYKTNTQKAICILLCQQQIITKHHLTGIILKAHTKIDYKVPKIYL